MTLQELRGLLFGAAGLVAGGVAALVLGYGVGGGVVGAIGGFLLGWGVGAAGVASLVVRLQTEPTAAEAAVDSEDDDRT